MHRFPEPDRLRGIAILFVVAIHSFAYLRISTDGAWLPIWFIVHQTGVPAFFLADGWLHGKRHRRAMSKSQQAIFLMASARRLLVPWCAFSLIYLLLRLLSETLGTSGGESVIAQGVAEIPSALWHSTSSGQLYFLPALMIVRIITVQMHRIVVGSWLRAATLALALLTVWRIFVEKQLPVPTTGTDPLLAAATGLCFTSTGWLLAEVPRKQKIWAPVFSAVIFGIAGIGFNSRVTAICFQSATVLALWCAALLLPKLVAPVLQWLGRRSMEIYLLHVPVMLKLICTAVSLAHIGPVLGLPVTVAATSGAAIGVAAVLDRIGLGWLWKPYKRAALVRC